MASARQLEPARNTTARAREAPPSRHSDLHSHLYLMRNPTARTPTERHCGVNVAYPEIGVVRSFAVDAFMLTLIPANAVHGWQFAVQLRGVTDSRIRGTSVVAARASTTCRAGRRRRPHSRVSARSLGVFLARSVFCVAQPPDERPDRDPVDVQDVLGEVDRDRLVLLVVAVGAELHVAFRAVMRWRTIRPRLRPLPSARGAAESALSVSPADVCGTCRRAVDAYQHWPRGVFARSADERSISYDAIRLIGSFGRRPFFAQALLALLPWL